MIGDMNLRKTWFVIISTLILAVSAAQAADVRAKGAKPSPAQTKAKAPSDAGEWKKVVEAAKREGRLVISGSPSEEWRKSLVDLFIQEYPEITVEYTGMNARDFWPRVRQERELGKKLWDLRAGGADLDAYGAKREGYLEPIRPLLLPEIADESRWIGGLNLLFYDKEKKFIPCYTIYIQRTTAVNRDFINETELKSSGQLLDPKFRGRIVIQTPTGGASFQALGNLAFMYGQNFICDLLSRQNVVVTNDNRQQAEWMVRGKYPITLGFNETQLIPFHRQGLGRNITKLEDKVTPVAKGFGGISLLKDAPHPNAARVYINWLLSQKTQLKVTKNVMLNSLRTDVPPVDKGTAVDPAHLGDYRIYSTEENMEHDSHLLPLIRESMKSGT